MLFKLFKLSSNLALSLDYLKTFLNNSAQVCRQKKKMVQ